MDASELTGMASATAESRKEEATVELPDEVESETMTPEVPQEGVEMENTGSARGSETERAGRLQATETETVEMEETVQGEAGESTRAEKIRLSSIEMFLCDEWDF